MIKKIVMLAVVGVMVFVTGNAYAQFGKLKGLVPAAQPEATSGVSTADLVTSKDNATATYSQAQAELRTSLEKAAQALHVKEDVLKLLADAKSYKEGNLTAAGLDKDRKISEDTMAEIKKKMDEAAAPSVEDKALMVESMAHLTMGVQKEKELVGTVQGLSTQAQAAVASASPMEMMKVKDIAGTAVTLVQALPKDIKLSTDILKLYVDYAKKNNIQSGEASKMLQGD